MGPSMSTRVGGRIHTAHTRIHTARTRLRRGTCAPSRKDGVRSPITNRLRMDGEGPHLVRTRTHDRHRVGGTSLPARQGGPRPRTPDRTVGRRYAPYSGRIWFRSPSLLPRTGASVTLLRPPPVTLRVRTKRWSLSPYPDGQSSWDQTGWVVGTV